MREASLHAASNCWYYALGLGTQSLGPLGAELEKISRWQHARLSDVPTPIGVAVVQEFEVVVVWFTHAASVAGG